MDKITTNGVEYELTYGEENGVGQVYMTPIKKYTIDEIKEAFRSEFGYGDEIYWHDAESRECDINIFIEELQRIKEEK